MDMGLSSPSAGYPPGSTREALAQRIDRPLEACVLVAAIATIPLVIALEQGLEDPLVVAADWLIWGIFVVDYLVHGVLSSDRRHFLRGNWLSAAIIVVSFPPLPYLFDLVRLARLLRLLRLAVVLTRGAEALRPVLGRPGLVYVGSLTGLLILAGGGILTLLEPDTVKGDFWNGVWWAVVTTTTVGYGDIAPVSLGGRLLGVVLMFTGIGLVATLAASIAAHFVAQDDRRQEQADTKMLIERLDRLETMLRDEREATGARSLGGSDSQNRRGDDSRGIMGERERDSGF